MASNSLQHAKDQAVLDYVEQAVLREGEAIRSKCIAKTSKPIRVFGLKEKYANVRNWLQADILDGRIDVRFRG
ncbi:MAG: hypothetical protein O7B98_15430 [Alphaproteobacteria bacterium]|nr:hypothetical protein [Alphaproteobacteria bacterium]